MTSRGTIRFSAVGERRRRGNSARGPRWAQLRQRIAPHRRRVGLLAGVSFVGGVVEAAFLVIITRTALAIADGRDSFGLLAGRTASIAGAVLIALVLLTVRLALALVAVRVSSGLVTQVLVDVRSELAKAYLQTSWSIQHGEPPARLQELLGSFASSASDAATYLSMALIGVLNLVALLIVSLTINPVATLVVVAVLAVLGSVLAPIRTRIRSRARRASQVQVQLATEVAELGALSMVMQTAGVHDQFADRLSHLVERDATSRRQVLVMRGALAPIYTCLAFGAIVGGLAVSAALSTGELGGAAAVMLVMLRALNYGQQVQTASGALAASLPYLDALAETVKTYEAARAPDGDLIVERVGLLEVRDASFSYQVGRPVLHDLSFRIHPGEIVGIIGPSGSGKSTLVQLLLGLRDPTVGCIEVDGVDLRRIERRRWTEQTAFVAQEASLLSGSVAENVAFFRDRIDRARHRAGVSPSSSRRGHCSDAGWHRRDGRRTRQPSLGRPAPACIDREGVGRRSSAPHHGRAHFGTRCAFGITDPRHAL